MDEQICASGEIDERLTRCRVTRQDDRAVRRINAEGEGILKGGMVHEGGRYPDVVILKYEACPRYFFHGKGLGWWLAAGRTNTDVEIFIMKGNGCLVDLLHRRWADHLDLARHALNPGEMEKIRVIGIVVGMVMRDENGANIGKAQIGCCEAGDRTITTIEDINRTIYNERI